MIIIAAICYISNVFAYAEQSQQQLTNTAGYEPKHVDSGIANKHFKALVIIKDFFIVSNYIK